MSDYIDRDKTYMAIVEKGQHCGRGKLGENWELNGYEIQEVLNSMPSVNPSEKILTIEIKCTDEEKQKIINDCLDILNERLVEELEEIKAEISTEFKRYGREWENGYNNGLKVVLTKVENHIAELKGENK